MTTARWALAAVLGLVGAGADAAYAEPDGLLQGDKVPRSAAPSPSPSLPAGLPPVVTDCASAAEFGGTELERAGYCQLQNFAAPDHERYVGVRTFADRALLENPRSFRAHFLMGIAQHLGEANLPKALFHLEQADELLVERHGPHPAVGEPPWVIARRILLELVYVHGEMDHHEQKIRYVDLLAERLGVDYSPLKAWPLLKLKRWDEARAAAVRAVDADNERDAYWKAVGLTALCAIESEMRNRQAAYDACMAAARDAMPRAGDGGVALSNAASAALEVFKFDEAERLYREAARRDVEGTINPWGRLTHLYLRQGRMAEALAALREMKTYRYARPAYFDQQDQTDAELTGAALLMVAGLMEDALRITSRTVNRPDRQGTSSAAFDQNEAGNLIMDRVARLDVARRLEEEASWSPWREALRLRARAAKLRLEAWERSRRAETTLSDEERLLTTLRPECPGSIELPNWLDPEAIAIVGPGVARAAIDRARKEETLPENLAGPVFTALEAEAALLAGDEKTALSKAEEAVKTLVPSEALARARVAAVGAEAAARLGNYERAMSFYALVLHNDPGVLRRMGLRLPVVIDKMAEDEAIDRAAQLLEASPFFEVGQWGFSLGIEDDSVILRLPDGSFLFHAPVKAGPKDVDSVARRIARAAHQDLLVPSVDVTQADIRSLDGGLTGGGRATERAKSVLDEVMGQ